MIPSPCLTPRCPTMAEHRGRCKAHNRRRAQERGPQHGYAAWRRLRLTILKRDPVCQICYAAPSVHVDHIVPKVAGGRDDEDNLRGACQRCNCSRPGQRVC